jgi:drug/metabolite transporter (DMT)-like permease
MTFIILMYALWASSMPISKYMLRFSSPLFLAGARFFVSGVAIFAYQYFWNRGSFKFQKKHWWSYAEIALFGVCITYMLRFWALQDMSATKTCFLYNLSPFVSSFYSYLMFRERITPRQWLGLTIGFLGLIPILTTSSGPEARMGEFLYISWQEFAVLISIATHSYSWIVMRKLVRYKNFSAMAVNGITMTAGGLALLLGSLFFEVWYQGTQPVTEVGTFFTWLIVVVLLSNVICHNMYASLLKKYTATFMSFAGFIAPLFTALYGWAFLDEIITWHFYLSSVIVFIGLFLFYKDELNKDDSVEPIID